MRLILHGLQQLRQTKQMLIAIKVFIYFLVCITIAAYTSLLERKLIARIQLRRGPDNCGFLGIFQPIADALKLLLKRVQLRQYTKISIFAVILLFSTSLVQLILIPFSNDIFIFRYGLLFILLCHALIVFSEILLGISQKSKYGIIGANRAYLQIIGAHIPFMLSIVSIMLIFDTLSLNGIVNNSKINFIILIPLLFSFLIILLISENRTPFDFVEAESEIISGAYVEYGGILFAIIYLSDYLNLLFISALVSTIFFNGYVSEFLPASVAILLKTLIIASIIILIRAILPRYRQDQMIKISWMILTPIILIYIFSFI